MTTVYYPGMGVDIVTPVLCVDGVTKIIATGPYEGTFTGKNQLQKVFDCICKLANSGAIQDEETGEWVEFWPQPVFDEDVIVPVTKKYFFKTKQMWLMQFTYQNRMITLNYYTSLNPNDKNYVPPDIVSKEKVDYIIHKSFKWKINQYTYPKILKDCVKFDKDGTCLTKLIGTKSDLRGVWQFGKEEFEITEESSNRIKA